VSSPAIWQHSSIYEASCEPVRGVCLLKINCRVADDTSKTTPFMRLDGQVSGAHQIFQVAGFHLLAGHDLLDGRSLRISPEWRPWRDDSSELDCRRSGSAACPARWPSAGAVSGGDGGEHALGRAWSLIDALGQARTQTPQPRQRDSSRRPSCAWACAGRRLRRAPWPRPDRPQRICRSRCRRRR